MSKKFCPRCRRIFVSDSGSFICDSCVKFQNYKLAHQNVKYKDTGESPKMFFQPGNVYNLHKEEGNTFGFFAYATKKIYLYLFAFGKKLDPMHIYISIYSHEFMHQLIAETEDNETSSKYDNIAEDIEEYLDLNFRGQ